MSGMKLYDVAIAGAGPAGSALAVLLARAGHSVLLLDQKRFPRDKVCGDFVSPKGLRSLERLGCGQAIERARFLPIRSSSVFLNGTEISRGDLPVLPDHPAHAHVIPRAVLDEMIFRKAQAEGADTVEDCRVTGFHTTSEIAAIEATVEGQPRRYAARILVGADGATSTMARRAGLDAPDPRYAMAAVRAYCRGLSIDRTLLYFDEEFFPGFGWVFPSRDGVANIGVGMLKEPLVKHGLNLQRFYDRLVAFVQSLPRQSGSAIEIEGKAGAPIKTYGARARNTFERGLLIGEAAGLVDPISGEGIPLALESAEMAAEVLHAALVEGDCSERALSEYDRRWRERWEIDLGISDLVVSMIRNRYLVKLWLMSFRVMAMTALQNRDYALRTGGILAGLIPNREGLAPDIVLKSLLHGPGFWRRVFELEAQPPISDLARRSASLLRWQSEVLDHASKDPEWFIGWLAEIGGKQATLLRNLPKLGIHRTPIVGRPQRDRAQHAW
jgi:geranylgeranyl reductase family protein